jgi:WD40 repeat protein
MTTYKIGGILPANADTYVVRQADLDLEAYLRAGEFCYILNSRQMGKSSLKLRMMKKLQLEGVTCAEIDLTGIGADGVSEKQWYNSIADELATQFDLESELELFWDSHPQLSSVSRLAKFIDTIILEQIAGRIVIFVDEIDLVISLDSFTDDFFRLIRSCAERGATRTKYQRLSFVLIGVATPTDLIENKQSTPFNIGQPIDLQGLKLTDDLSPLTNGLVGIVANPEFTIAEIINWTGGQPFLTQKICQLVVEFPQDSIAKIVQQHIINNWEDRDHPIHLKTIVNRLLGNRGISIHLLEQYRQIITTSVGLNIKNSPEQQQLRLSGLVVERDGKLQVYNPIYAQVFNLDWIDRELANICPYSKALIDWLDNGRSDSLLLRGDALDEAIVWKEFQWRHNQLIGIEGASFIDASQAKRTDWKLAKIKNRISRFIKVLSVLIVIGLVLLSTLIWFDRSLKILDQINRFDRASSQIMQQYEFAPLDALKAAIVNAKNFQKSQPTLLENLAPMPKLAIQKLVDSIQEIDEINTSQQGINAINFCRNDRIFIAGSDGTVAVWERDAIDRKSREIVQLGAEIKINSVSHPSSECTDTFATASSDGKIRVWQWNGQVQTKAKLIVDPQIIAHQQNDINHDGGVQNIRLTEDSRYIFSTGKADGKLKKWKIDRDKLIPIGNIDGILAHEKGVMSLNFNGKKDRIGTAGKDGTAKIWNLDLEAPPIALTGHNGAVNSIYFCSTVSENCPEYEIATGSDDGTVRLWKADGTYIKTINAHAGEVRAVRFSPDGKLLATASAKDPTMSNGSSVRIWNLKDGKLITEFKGHQGAIESMRFKPSSPEDKFQQLATSGRDDSTIRVWKVPEIMPTKHKHPEKINSVRFDPRDSNYFITAGEDGTIRWWNRTSDLLPQLRDTFDKYQNRIKFKTIRIHPQSDIGIKTIAVGDSSGVVRILKIENDRITEVSNFDTQQGSLESMDWSNKVDRYLLATTGAIGADVKIWEIDVNKNKLAKSQPIYQKNWDYSKLSLRFSGDGNNLAIGTERSQVILIKNINNPNHNPTAHPLQLVQDIGSKVTIGFSKDDRFLTIVSQEGKIWISDLEPKLINDRPIETYQVGTENIAIGKNGEIATGGAGAALRLWNLQGSQIADFRGYWGVIRSINFSKDDKYLLAGGDDGIPIVWQIDRDIPTLIKQGCQWLNQGYFQSDSLAKQKGSSAVKTAANNAKSACAD